MKKIFLLLTISFIAMPLWLYCMEPAPEQQRASIEAYFKRLGLEQPTPEAYLTRLEPTSQESSAKPYFTKLESGPQQQEPRRLFISNNRNDAVVVEYMYQEGKYKNIPLERVVYPQEVIWIGDPEDISRLIISPYGVLKQYITIPKIIKGPSGHAPEMKKKIGKGGVAMVISQPALFAFLMTSQTATLMPYEVTFDSISSSSIESLLSLGKCDHLGTIFRRAGIALKATVPEEKIIRPEYILGVPPKPTDLRLVTSYKVSLEQARNDLIAGWSEVRSVISGLKKETVIELIKRAYNVLSAAQKDEEALFSNFASRLFKESAEAASKVMGCKVE